MTVPQLIKALQSLKDDENAKIAECKVYVYCEEKKMPVEEITQHLMDGFMIVSRVERDPDNAVNEVTIYFKHDPELS